MAGKIGVIQKLATRGFSQRRRQPRGRYGTRRPSPPGLWGPRLRESGTPASLILGFADRYDYGYNDPPIFFFIPRVSFDLSCVESGGNYCWIVFHLFFLISVAGSRTTWIYACIQGAGDNFLILRNADITNLTYFCTNTAKLKLYTESGGNTSGN